MEQGTLLVEPEVAGAFAHTKTSVCVCNKHNLFDTHFVFLMLEF